MKVGILAGGVGTRFSEETIIRPKPMIEIGGKPILWHILKHYEHYGFNEFAIALGYKGDMVKKFFIDYSLLQSDITVDMNTGRIMPHRSERLDWRVDLIDTGPNTNTGGRIKRLIPHMGGETFMLTWGDGLSDVNLHDLAQFHRSHGRLATITAVRAPARFGYLQFEDDRITNFDEKPETGDGWIHGAFMVLEPGVADYIDGDVVAWEREPLVRLSEDKQLMAYRHTAFWRCMDTRRDQVQLEKMWERGNAPWASWMSTPFNTAAE